MPSYDVADTLMAPFAIRHCAVAVPVKLPVPVTVSVYVPTAVPVFPLTVNVTGSPSTVTPATDCVNSRDADALEQILKASDGGVDVALDATGIDATVNMAIRSVHLNGKVVLIGNLAPKVDFPLQIAVTRQLSLFGSCASAGEYPACLDLISSGQVEVDSMISKKIPLAEGNLWMNKIYNREDGLTKIVFLCDENQD